MIRDAIKQLEEKVPLQPYTIEEMALLYNITAKTFCKWIQPFEEKIGKKIGWYFNIKQVEIIFENIGRPEINKRK